MDRQQANKQHSNYKQTNDHIHLSQRSFYTININGGNDDANDDQGNTKDYRIVVYPSPCLEI